MCLRVNEAILISDCHFNRQRLEFLEFLNLIESKKLKTQNLFLLGDIFDFLSQEVDYSIEYNRDVIEKIDNLSKEINIYYLEGNHDFHIKRLFPNAKVFPRGKQPILLEINNKKIHISHGDLSVGISYEFFTVLLRNRAVLKTIATLDKIFFNKKIVKYVFDFLSKKDICKKYETFSLFLKKRVAFYQKIKKVDFIIEGHFHQGKNFSNSEVNYINIPSFACEKSFFIIKSNQNGFALSKSKLKEL